MKVPLLALSAALTAMLVAQDRSNSPVLPEIGKPAPTFRLNDHEGRAISIGPTDEASWTVLAFYPKAATPG